MTMITPSYLGETIEYSSLHACRSTLEDPTDPSSFPFDILVARTSVVLGQLFDLLDRGHGFSSRSISSALR